MKEGVLVSTGNYSTNAVFTFVLLEALFCFVSWQNIATKYKQIGWAVFVWPAQLAGLRYLLNRRSCHAKRVARTLWTFSLNLLAGYPARKLQQSHARYFCQPCLSNVLSNLLFDPIEMGFVVFSLMRKRWITLRLQIFRTYFKIF